MENPKQQPIIELRHVSHEYFVSKYAGIQAAIVLSALLLVLASGIAWLAVERG